MKLNKKLLIPSMIILLIVAFSLGYTYAQSTSPLINKTILNKYSGMGGVDVIVFMDGDYAVAMEKTDVNKNGIVGDILVKSMDHSYVIQKAINYTYSYGGGKIYIEGNFSITKTIDVFDGVQLIGNGKRTILTAEGNITIFNIIDRARIKIADMKFDANGYTVKCIAGSFRRSIIENIIVEKLGSNSVIIYSNDMYNNIIRRISGITVNGADNVKAVEIIGSGNGASIIEEVGLTTYGGTKHYAVKLGDPGATDNTMYITIIHPYGYPLGGTEKIYVWLSKYAYYNTIINPECYIAIGYAYYNLVIGGGSGSAFEVYVGTSEFGYGSPTVKAVTIIGSWITNLVIDSGVVELQNCKVSAWKLLSGNAKLIVGKECILSSPTYLAPTAKIEGLESSGTVIIPAGQTSIYIQHGLVVAPSVVLVTLNDTVTYSVPFINSTHFEIVLGSSTSTPIKVYWEAKT